MGPPGPKRRRFNPEALKDDLDTSKPTAVFQPSSGRKYMLSVALPGSIIANAQSHDLKTTLAGHIARALAVFCVDEVIVFDDGQCVSSQPSRYTNQLHHQDEGSASGYNGYANPNRFLAHLLAYLETPPHLRKQLFPLHPDLRTAGTLPSLDMPHHLRAHEWCIYREGISRGPIPNEPSSSYVDVGYQAPVKVQGAEIPEYARVTVKFDKSEGRKDVGTVTQGGQTVQAVAPSAPREESGYYWGYQVREAGSLSAVITECPFVEDGGYDLTWGTSERGTALAEVVGEESMGKLPDFRHMLIVFGGVAGLEAAAKADRELAGMGVTKPEELFDYWVNLCPGQGSRTIRTEEAIWLGLMGLREVVTTKGGS